jgi:hypothetical protein
VFVQGVVARNFVVAGKVEGRGVVFRPIHYTLLKGRVHFAPRDRRSRTSEHGHHTDGNGAFLHPDLETGQILRSANGAPHGVKAPCSRIVVRQPAQAKTLRLQEQLTPNRSFQHGESVRIVAEEEGQPEHPECRSKTLQHAGGNLGHANAADLQ